jgi:hypothetical protein
MTKSHYGSNIILEILTILLTIPVLSFSIFIYLDAEGQQPRTNLVRLLSSDQRIAFTKYIDLFDSEEIPYFSFNLTNNSNEVAKNIRIIPSSLTAKEEPVLTSAPSFIGSGKIKLEPSAEYAAIIKDQPVVFKLGNEATYQGQLKIIGER